MDTTIRNLDEVTYRQLKARAALEGKTLGEAVNDALRTYLAHPQDPHRTGSVFDLPHADFGPGTEHLSEQIDEIVYGA